jgi:SAM-dependent methyltransferase
LYANAWITQGDKARGRRDIPASADSSEIATVRLTEEVRTSDLRADLLDADYTVDRLRELWGPVSDQALRRDNPVPARRALAGSRHPAATIARLFLLGEALDDALLDGAFPRTGAVGLRARGVLGSEGRALVEVRPYSAVDATGVVNWWIVSDHGEMVRRAPLAPDHVLGVGGASITLAGLVPTSPARRVLDLGTGSGVQALHARRSADSVVATDLSERALALAALTFELSGIEQIELRHGDMFAPVVGEQFDRIVSNPPFVITPREHGVDVLEYRDGGRVGDGIVEELVRALPDYLEPGGTAHLLGNWEYRAGADGLDRVRAWVEAAGLDAWVIERERQDVAEYAETWLRDGGVRTASAAFEPLAEAWLDDFALRGVTHVGFGYLTLRRPLNETAPRLRRFERVASTSAGRATGLGDIIAAGFAAHDLIAPLDDNTFAQLHVSVAPDITEDRHFWPGAEHPTVMRLVQGSGLGRVIDLDTGLSAVVGACDGELPVRVIIDAVAALMEVDAAQLAAELVPRLRELLVLGVLTVGVNSIV